MGVAAGIQRAGIAQSVLRLATGWNIRKSNLGDDNSFSLLVYTCLATHPSSSTMDTWFASQLRLAGRSEFYLCLPSGP